MTSRNIASRPINQLNERHHALQLVADCYEVMACEAEKLARRHREHAISSTSALRSSQIFDRIAHSLRREGISTLSAARSPWE